MSSKERHYYYVEKENGWPTHTLDRADMADFQETNRNHMVWFGLVWLGLAITITQTPPPLNTYAQARLPLAILL